MNGKSPKEFKICKGRREERITVSQGPMVYADRLYARGYIPERMLAAVQEILNVTEGELSVGYSMNAGTVKEDAGAWPGEMSPERLAALDRFCDWADRLDAHGIPAGAILDILLDGANFASTDRKFRKRNGWSKAQLIASLSHHPFSQGRSSLEDGA